jgi:hypothetical protein
VEKRYSPDSINLVKIQLQVGELFKETSLDNRALQLYELIDKNMESQIKARYALERIESETDDEKFMLRKKILKEL